MLEESGPRIWEHQPAQLGPVITWRPAMTFTHVLALVFLAAIVVGCDADKVRRLEKENQELAAKLDAVTKGASLDLQKKCADQSGAIYKELGWDTHQLASSYTNHYNQKMNKCFLQIERTGSGSETINLSDAFEGKVYGYYELLPQRRVEPLECKVWLPSGHEKICESKDEFHSLVKVYMEE